MDHQQFENWLLTGQPLTPAQQRTLQAHITTCSACAALARVNQTLNAVKIAKPVPGFNERFQTRLAAFQKARRKRRLWGIFILVMGGLGILLWLAWPFLSSLSASPSETLSAWIEYLAALVIFLQTTVEAGSVLLDVFPGFIPSYFWGLTALVFGGFVLLWVVSIRKYIKVAQGV